MPISVDAPMSTRTPPAGAHVAPAVGGWSVTRARFTMASDVSVPMLGPLYVVPFLAAVYNDGDVTMNEDSTVTINRSGLYRASMSGSWLGRVDGQADLRIFGVGHGVGGQKPGTYVPGRLTKCTAQFDRLVQIDMPSSNTTRTNRYKGRWRPGTIAMGQVVHLDVRLARTGVVDIGDLAFASHTGIVASTMGVKEAATLIVTAKVVGPDVVRVSLFNPSIKVGIRVPMGDLEVVAMTAVSTTGNSGQGQILATSAMEPLKAGDCVFGVFRSWVMRDQLLARPSTFMQIERWA